MENHVPYPQLADVPWAYSLCFTGHRPEKLPKGDVLNGLLETLYYYIRRAKELGFTHYFIGLADGIDYFAAEYLFRMRETMPEIHVIGIQPCEDYPEFFRQRGYDLSHLTSMTEHVDKLVILPGRSEPKCFLKRNRVMADHSSGIIAVCGDGRSGSLSTLNYAKKHSLPYCRIYPEPLSKVIPAPQDWRVERHGF